MNPLSCTFANRTTAGLELARVLLGAARVIVAAPVTSDAAHALVHAEADEVVVLRIESHLSSVGAWYDDFDQVEDSKVCELLARSRAISGRMQHENRSVIRR